MYVFMYIVRSTVALLVSLSRMALGSRQRARYGKWLS